MQMRKRCWITLVMAAGMFTAAAIAQEKPSPDRSADLANYDVNRETNLLGTVQSFTPIGQTAPLGAHVTLLTSSGVVYVHLGSAKLLTANQFTIQSGDRLRIVGENVAYGNRTQFIARIVQKGTQILAVRSIRGIPLSCMAPGERAKAHGGVL